MTEQVRPQAPAAPEAPPRAGSGWMMGRLFGVPVYVAPSWAVVALLITVMFAEPVERSIPEIGGGKYAVSFAYAVLLYLSVLIHELGHARTAIHLGLPVRRITLQLLGGVTEMDGQAPTPRREFSIAAAGPALSLLLGLAAWVAIRALGADPGGITGPSAASNPADSVSMRITLELLDALLFANVVVGLFNLLPGLPLDGGIMLRSAIWGITGRNAAATVAAGWIGRGLAVVVFFVPIALDASTGGQIRPISVVWGALLGGFIWIGATASIRGAHIRELLPRLQARTLTRRAIAVASDVPLAEAVRQAGAAGAYGLVVVDAGGRPIGLVNEAAVQATPEDRRPWVSVSTVSRTLEPTLVLNANLTGEKLIRTLEATAGTEYLVVEDDGAIYGILSATDVQRALAGT
ncbi:MAG: M50 family metallopeptidase [Sporichthyaceae bacterium]